MLEQIFDPLKPALGTLLVSEEVRGNFEVLERASQLKPYPGQLVDVLRPLTLWVASGDYSVDSTSTRHFDGIFTDDAGASPGVPWGDVLLPLPVVDPRVDIVYITAGGVLTITQGVENPAPTAPPYPANTFPIAEVTVSPGMLEITSDDIRDVRPMYVFSNAGLGINPNAEAFVAIAGQTVFVLSAFQYAPGSNEILVYAGGVYKAVTLDYAETAVDRITFHVGRPAGENIVIYRVGAASAQYFADLNDITVDISNAVRDPLNLRATPADVNNPLATIADVGGIIPFGVEHNSGSGAHGPKVTIIQTNADNALVVSKINTGAGAAVTVANAGTSPGIRVVQSGASNALSILQLGNSSAMDVTQSGSGNALNITHNAASGNAIDINFTTPGVSNIPIRVTRLTSSSYEPLVRLHDSATPSGVNLSIFNNIFTLANELGSPANTPKFLFDVLNGGMTITGGTPNQTRLTIQKTNTGTGNSITITHGGSGHAISITNTGSGDCLRIINPGTGADIRVGATILDPLWGGATSNADALHTHTSDALNAGAGIVLTSLNDVTNAEAQAFHDSDPGGPYRTSPATGTNPLSTIDDILSRIPLVKFGGYIGNGTSQTIAVGFEPDWVQVYNVDNATHSGVYVANGEPAGRYFITTGTVNITIVPTGFQVSDGTGPINLNSNHYKYIAFKGNVPLP